MTRFDRVLSDDELWAAAAEVEWQGTIGQYRLIEQAVLAKLAEQVPVAWRVWLKDLQCWSYSCDYHGCGEPLYTHPMPNSQGLLDSSNHAVGNNEMVTPLAQRKIQTLLDKGEYRVIENATVLVNERGHAAIVNRGGAFYWVDNEGLAREFDASGEGNKESDNQRKIEWLDPKHPHEFSPYLKVKAKEPFSEYSIRWKEQREQDGFDLYVKHNVIETLESLEAAKDFAENHLRWVQLIQFPELPEGETTAYDAPDWPAWTEHQVLEYARKTVELNCGLGVAPKYTGENT